MEVVDSDGGEKYEVIGDVITQLGSVVGAQKQTYTADIYKSGDKNKRGQVICRVVPVTVSDTEVKLKLACRNLPMNTSCFCVSSINPYIIIDKSVNLGGKMSYVSIHRTEVSTSQTPHPIYKPMKFMAQQLCNSDLKQKFQIKIYNKNDEGTPSTLIGVVQRSVGELLESRQFKITDETGKEDRDRGLLIIEDIEVIEKPTFLEYLKTGWGISLSIAIDYTGSNGDYTQPDSLHYLGGYN